MILDNDKIAALRRTFQVIVENFYQNSASAAYTTFTRELPLDGTSLELDWMLNLPTLQEWVGERYYDSFRAHNIVIPVKDYSKAVKLPVKDIVLDKSGIIASTVQKMFEASANDYDKLATDKLLAGCSTGPASIGHDGVAFFSTAHPYGPGGATQSNRTSSVLSQTAFRAARTAMMSLRDENGEPLAVSPTVLVVGPKNESLAREIVVGELRGLAVDNSGAESGTRIGVAGVSNVDSGYGIRVVVSKRLVGAHEDKWFLVDDSKEMLKPIVLGTAGPPTPSDNMNQFMDEPFAKFAVSLHAAVGFGPWQAIYGGGIS